MFAPCGSRRSTSRRALAIDIRIHPPDRRRRDIDNMQKALLDAMQHGGAYLDDSQIVRLAIEKGLPLAGGKTVVRIQKVPG